MLHHGAPAAHLQTEDFCGGGFLIGVYSRFNEIHALEEIKNQSEKFISSSAYQSKALDLAHSATPPLCQSGHRGCAGIGRQLLPLKVSYHMRDKVIKIDQKMIWGRGLSISI